MRRAGAVSLAAALLLSACGSGGATVPSVVGLTLTRAVKTLGSHGFCARRIVLTARLLAQPGRRVFRQVPAAGARRPTDTPVSLFLGVGYAPGTNASVSRGILRASGCPAPQVTVGGR